MLIPKRKDSPAQTMVIVTEDGTAYRCEYVTSWTVNDGLLVCSGHDPDGHSSLRAAFVLANLFTFHWE